MQGTMHKTKLKEGEAREDMELNEIWRACRKIQGAIFRYKFDICKDLKQHDPHCTGFVSKSMFTAVMAKYRNVAGLSEFELRDITDYFQIRDGRVAYRQFCKVVCCEDLHRSAKKELVTSLEWNDPWHLNVIPQPEERRKLFLILLKIAQETHLPLMPYFQDYELVARNVGVVTVSHFARVLHFMKIPLAESDFLLLLKRYMKDAYLVNYVAFVKHIDNIMEYLKYHKLLDNSREIIQNFPGRLVDLNLSELPPVDGCKVIHPIFPDTCNHPKKNRDQCDIIFCIQNFVYKNRVRCSEFLECFDQLRTGSITKNQFERALHNIGVGKFISQRELDLLADRYMDPVDTNRIRWRTFMDEIDTVFTIKNLEKIPQCNVESPLKHIIDMPRPGTADWQAAPLSLRELCEDAMAKIRIRIRNRRLHLHPFFRNYDKLNSGHVRCNQTNQIFRTNGILLSDQEVEAVLHRYGNEMGFFYTKFLDDVDPASYGIPSMVPKGQLHDMNECPPFARDTPDEDEQESEENIMRVLTVVKQQVLTRSVPIIDFLADYDRHREGEILDSDFKRAMSSANVVLSDEDATLMCNIFRSSRRAPCMRYRDFVKALNQIFVQLESEMGDKIVTAVPLLHLPNLDCISCFLNFDERTTCSRALMKLARKPDEISNLSQIFTDFDRSNCGSVSENQLLRALTVREMHEMLSRREFDAVCKCFAVERGLHMEFNYREFLKILDVLHRTGQVKRNF
ncbi:uncharacterized protein LOC115621463 [Scaptodrosophila lebanonensis]|uniref:Uncharacterized protein LOC115621463 n=1 Tax=Drosophila lebanonensis TaxID=7225 RepID=A0A6J2T252_DROLE|nr:uncharacterized protein LOC115621463 [Scaptodrosophila lebanonensis]XP_030370981.1 uncharacterized protein LOC115621463 [Scaptodrosophila lebanonensis]